MRSVRSSSIAPGKPGDVVYLVLDDFGPIDPSDDEAHVIHNLLTGEYSRPQRIVAFSVAEGWARDVTDDVARKVIDQAMTSGQTVPGQTVPGETRDLALRAIGVDVPAAVRE
jgi:hypothetical protein